MKTLRKSREERWQSANELYAELGSVKLDLDLEAHKERTRTGICAPHPGAREATEAEGQSAGRLAPAESVGSRTTNTSPTA